MQVNTLIIGGGISGLACGRTLHDAGEGFVLVSPDLGGRMRTSSDGTVNYGASYVTNAYTHALRYVGRGPRIRTRDCAFVNKKLTTFYSLLTVKHIPQLIVLWAIVWDFKRRLRRLRKQAPHTEQRKLLEQDPVLKGYVKEHVRDFVGRMHIKALHERYFCPLFCSTGFYYSERCNVFYYLDNLLPLFSKAYKADFTETITKLTKGWEHNINKAKATSMVKKKGYYHVQTTNGTYKARNVVLALPYQDANKLTDVPKPAHTASIYVLHVRGQRKPKYRIKPVIFFRSIFKHQDHDVTILWRQKDGTDILFSRVTNPRLRRYYYTHKLIKRVHWNTATVLSDKRWVPQNLDKGLYLASDYNICGLEDALLTGVYAGNQIIQQSDNYM